MFLFLFLLPVKVKGADPESPEFLLLNAVYNQDLHSVVVLLSRGANVNARDNNNETPLMFALAGGNDTIIHILLDQGADIKAIDAFGKSVLMHAVINGERDFVYTMITQTEQVNHQDISGYSALIYAVQEDDLEMAQLLVSAGANIELITVVGTTALMHAAAFGSFYCADFLIFQQADVHKKAEDGSKALHLAAFYGHSEIIGLLVEAGALIDEPDLAGNSPLMIAVIANQVDACWYLIESGASLETTTRDGFSLLSMASALGQNEIYWLLRQYGLQESPDMEKRQSALAYAYFTRNHSLRSDIKRNGDVKPAGLYFSELWFSQGADFNSTDLMYHSAAGIFESRFRMLITFNFLTRINTRRVMVPQRENFIYRFHEKRNLWSIGMFREINLLTFSTHYRIGLLPGVELGFTTGRYAGSGIEPPQGFRLNPAIGLYLYSRRFAYQASYNYFNIGHDEFKPFRFRIGITYRLPLYKTRPMRYRPVLN
jgi:ankyrin repeat protein